MTSSGPTRRLDLRWFETFRTVAEAGSLSRAAERLRVSQSTVSRQISLLEKELGTILLHRGARRVRLTQPGSRVLRLAGRVLGEMQELGGQLVRTTALRHGSLTVAGGMTACMYILPPLLKRYRALYPDIELRVVAGGAAGIQQMVQNQEVDLALMTLPIVGANLEVIPALREELVVVTGPDHPLGRRRTIDPRTLGQFPLIIYELGSNTRKLIDQFFWAQNVPMNVTMETENVEIIKAMVATGLGISLVPYSAVVGDLKDRKLGLARIRGRRPYRETGWVHVKSQYVPRTVTEMLRVFDLMKAQFRVGRLEQ